MGNVHLHGQDHRGSDGRTGAEACTYYQIETALYGPTGERLWHMPDAPGDGLRYGSDVMLDSQGRVIVAGAVTDKGALRGLSKCIGSHGPDLGEQPSP